MPLSDRPQLVQGKGDSLHGSQGAQSTSPLRLRLCRSLGKLFSELEDQSVRLNEPEQRILFWICYFIYF